MVQTMCAHMNKWIKEKEGGLFGKIKRARGRENKICKGGWIWSNYIICLCEIVIINPLFYTINRG
jgi:hypothetical protein